MARQRPQTADGDARAEEVILSEVAEIGPRISPSVHRLLGSGARKKALCVRDSRFDLLRLSAGKFGGIETQRGAKTERRNAADYRLVACERRVLREKRRRA